LTNSEIIDHVFKQPYLMEFYKHVQKEGRVLVMDENNHYAVDMLVNLLLELDILSDGHCFSHITISINFSQWDHEGCFLEKIIISQLAASFMRDKLSRRLDKVFS